MARKSTVIYDEDAPELTDAELASVRPARDVLPAATFTALLEAEPKRRPGQRGPGRKPPLVPITIRVEPATREALRSIGPRWQSQARLALQAATQALADTAGRPIGKAVKKVGSTDASSTAKPAKAAENPRRKSQPRR